MIVTGGKQKVCEQPPRCHIRMPTTELRLCSEADEYPWTCVVMPLQWVELVECVECKRSL